MKTLKYETAEMLKNGDGFLFSRYRQHMRFFITMIVLLIWASVPTVTNAQTETTPKSLINPQDEAVDVLSRIDDNMVAMENLAEAMSNNLGQLHYLRTLCYSDEDQTWRNVASDMMDLEAPRDGPLRRQLIRAFNAGYYEQQGRYQRCTNIVAIDVAALAENGRRLSAMLGDPYREH
jgi:uncharacterized protein (TIGR02301 family)